MAPFCLARISSAFVQKCAQRTGFTERITQVDGAHWPLNRGCALQIGSTGHSRADDRRTLWHEKRMESKMAVIAQGSGVKGTGARAE